MIVPNEDTLEQLGRTLREIDPSTLSHDSEGGEVRWFLGEDGTELFAWGPKDAPDHLQLVFGRCQVEWSAGRGLSMASFRSPGTTSGGRYDAYLLGVERPVDPEVTAAALRLLRSSNVPPPIVAPMVAALESALER